MQNRSGMTLMELIVGLVITGVMAAMGTAAFGSIIDHRRVIKESTVEMERAVALRETLRLWIASGTVQVRAGGGPRGLRGGGGALATTGVMGASANAVVSAAQASGDEITFTTSAPNPAMAPSVRIRLFIDGDESTPETGLTMEYQTNNATPLQRRELDPTIGSMTVEFLDARTHRWFASTQASTINPTAVRVALFPPEGKTLPAILQLPLLFPLLGGAQ
jgi:prepilin-type N-terminal cleavage/methylation domain-containing protein